MQSNNVPDKALDIYALSEQGRYAVAVLGGGCFWCMQAPFDVLDGVIKTIPGYSGGTSINPNYKEVCSGNTGHIEVVLVLFDPELVGFEQLLDIFWHNIDPTQVNRQFADIGSQYQTTIMYCDEQQQRLAIGSRDKLATSGKLNKPIATKIIPIAPFYVAEQYHHDYYKKNTDSYQNYRKLSGRNSFIENFWSN